MGAWDQHAWAVVDVAFVRCGAIAASAPLRPVHAVRPPVEFPSPPSMGGGSGPAVERCGGSFRRLRWWVHVDGVAVAASSAADLDRDAALVIGRVGDRQQ